MVDNSDPLRAIASTQRSLLFLAGSVHVLVAVSKDLKEKFNLDWRSLQGG
ncbi:hypothetical protein [Synechococcus elongatus]|nr:hypothetical protein [Synechococcus elongatus]